MLGINYEHLKFAFDWAISTEVTGVLQWLGTLKLKKQLAACFPSLGSLV
jgi:hypothetical protein